MSTASLRTHQVNILHQTGDSIKSLRKRKGISQYEAAHSIFDNLWPQSNLGRWCKIEQGIAKAFTLWEAIFIAEFFGTNLDNLCGGRVTCTSPKLENMYSESEVRELIKSVTELSPAQLVSLCEIIHKM